MDVAVIGAYKLYIYIYMNIDRREVFSYAKCNDVQPHRYETKYIYFPRADFCLGMSVASINAPEVCSRPKISKYRISVVLPHSIGTLLDSE
jgi:hypothetical protein